MNAFRCRTHRLAAHLRELFHNGPNYRLCLSSLNPHSVTLPVEAEITASSSLSSGIDNDPSNRNGPTFITLGLSNSPMCYGCTRL